MAGEDAERSSKDGRGTPLWDIASGCCSFTGPWIVTRSSLRMLRRVAAFCRPLRPVLLPVLFPRSRSPVVGVLGLCWIWHAPPPPPKPRQKDPLRSPHGVGDAVESTAMPGWMGG